MRLLDQEAWIKFPCAMEYVRVLSEAVPVIGGVVKNSPQHPLIKYLTETPEDPVLVTDVGMAGQDSLFLAVLTADESVIHKWLRLMARPNVYINARGGDIFIASPVKSFVP